MTIYRSSKGNFEQHEEVEIFTKKYTSNVGGRASITASGQTYFGQPDAPPPPVNKNIVDIIMFVPGTTDPININGEKHQANKNYWRDSQNNFWAKVKELKFQYHNLHIEDEFLSWSGDNNTEERNLAADRVLDLFIRDYPKFKNQETHLHLIGHSHGGNVINQFTELISSDKRFPKLWKIKSITYLSTPFFHKKHQLNHVKLHKDCKIINVHNEYDLTQRLVADFSLVNLEIFLRNFQIEKFQKGMNTLKSVNTSAFDVLYSTYIEDDIEGPSLWSETAKGLAGINQLTEEFINYIKSIDLNKPSLDKDRDQFVTILKSFLHWTYMTYTTFTKNSIKRKGGYGRSEFIEDLDLPSAIANLNTLFNIKTGVKDSYILHLLAQLFAENSGVTDSIEINSWTPKTQTKGLSILDLNITKYDLYNSRGKKAICDGFINLTSKALQNNNLEEVLMRLFSQFVKPEIMTYVVFAFHLAEIYFKGKTDAQIKILRKNIERYSTLVKQYHAGLVTKKDETEIIDMMKRPGTIPYLAMTSHGLSHTQFWPEVEDGLRNAFSSGKNHGYKKR
ncbi:hypothetical protein [Flavobacterium sp. KJJ]|uniref:hypothetical protein n=1 Tax=Flavobacterium sp. KJJ TaxID=1270193 RepID=UPI00049343D0|nr:hypothetical protein [Flavobacterium sp. KJJ]